MVHKGVHKKMLLVYNTCDVGVEGFEPTEPFNLDSRRLSRFLSVRGYQFRHTPILFFALSLKSWESSYQLNSRVFATFYKPRRAKVGPPMSE